MEHTTTPELCTNSYFIYLKPCTTQQLQRHSLKHISPHSNRNMVIQSAWAAVNPHPPPNKASPTAYDTKFGHSQSNCMSTNTRMNPNLALPLWLLTQWSGYSTSDRCYVPVPSLVNVSNQRILSESVHNYMNKHTHTDTDSEDRKILYILIVK